MEIIKKDFGKTASNLAVEKYTLINNAEHSVSVITYGGIITKINVPDSNNTVQNIVLGYDSIKEYEELSPFFGAITGPFAGRIDNAEFSIDQTRYELEKNDGTNCLHGGSKSFDKVVWSGKTTKSNDWVALELNYLSPDGEFGFPGNVNMYVTYTWDNNDTLTIDYKAKTDKATYLNLTNHSYFNLSGDLSSTILNHKLRIDADDFIAISPTAIPISIMPVSNTPFDFTSAKAVGKEIDADFDQCKNGNGYDHPFLLKEERDVTKPCAKVVDASSGRAMEVLTTEKYLVCYSGNYLTEVPYVFDQVPVEKRGAICLETQDCPNHMYFNDVPSYTLRPEATYQSQTKFKFFCE